MTRSEGRLSLSLSSWILTLTHSSSGSGIQDDVVRMPSDGNLYSSARYVVCQMLQELLVSTSLACFFMQLPLGQCATLRIKINFSHKEGKSS